MPSEEINRAKEDKNQKDPYPFQPLDDTYKKKRNYEINETRKNK
jgi:hypothetical protein